MRTSVHCVSARLPANNAISVGRDTRTKFMPLGHGIQLNGQHRMLDIDAKQKRHDEMRKSLVYSTIEREIVDIEILGRLFSASFSFFAWYSLALFVRFHLTDARMSSIHASSAMEGFVESADSCLISRNS